MIVLKNTDQKVDNVVHIADIHIRLTKRHEEYTSIFEKFYSSLDKLNKVTKPVLVIAGDIFHNKSDLSPECVKIGSDFLKNCADRVPIILTAGNHDATLANKSRLDCLTPIVEALNHTNLYYLKNTDVYRYENILFNNFSVFDEPEKYVKYDQIPTKYKNETDHHIALFHGPVNNAVTDVGYTVSSRSITNGLFDGHHIAMLGDIHKHQILQEYPSTLLKLSSICLTYNSASKEEILNPCGKPIKVSFPAERLKLLRLICIFLLQLSKSCKRSGRKPICSHNSIEWSLGMLS